MRLLRLFNDPVGIKMLKNEGIPDQVIKGLPLLGISSIANLLSCIKTAKHFEMNDNDILFSVATDSVDMYRSRLEELEEQYGKYSERQAFSDYERCLLGENVDNMKELTYMDRKRIHNLKYYTWIEQQGKELEDLNQLWYDDNIFNEIFSQTKLWEKQIIEFNKKTGVGSSKNRP